MLRFSTSRRSLGNASAVAIAVAQNLRAVHVRDVRAVAAAQAALAASSGGGSGHQRAPSLAMAAAALAVMIAASSGTAEARGEQAAPNAEPRLVRVPIAPRRGWREAVAREGVTYHTDPPPAGTPFWHDGAFYCLSAEQAETLRRATAELHHLCLQAVSHAVQHDEVLSRLGIAPHMWPLIKYSWRHRDTTDCGVYGRFDLRYTGGVPPVAPPAAAAQPVSTFTGVGDSGDGHPKMLEYNADTPTCLLEAGDAQAAWARDYARRAAAASGSAVAGAAVDAVDPPQLPSPHQFNAVHAQLVRGWERWLAGHVVLPRGATTTAAATVPTSIIDVAAAAALPREAGSAVRASHAAAAAAAPLAGTPPPIVVPVHFACVSETDEDYRTVQFMARCAGEAVLRDPTTGAAAAVIEPRFVFVEDVGWDDGKRCFVDTSTNYQLAGGRPFPNACHQPAAPGDALAGSGADVVGVPWTDASVGMPRRVSDAAAIPTAPAGPGSPPPAAAAVPAPIAVVPVPAAALTDGRDRAIRFLFKLYPYEHLASDAFAKHVVEGLDTAGYPVDVRHLAADDLSAPAPTAAAAASHAPRLRASPLRVELIESAWKMVLSNKAILPLLWELFPGHPNLLPAFWGLDDERARAIGMTQGLCAKPMLSREGANIVLFRLEKAAPGAATAVPDAGVKGAVTPRAAAALAANPIIRSLQTEAAKHGLRVVVDHVTEGTYGSGAYVLQARCEPPRIVPTSPLLRAIPPGDVLALQAAEPKAVPSAGATLPVTPACPVIGSWVIDHKPAGVIFREDAGPVTNNKSLFIPHLVAPPAHARMA